VAGLLVHPRPLSHTSLQAQALAGPGHILLHQTPLLPWGGRKALSMPPHRHRSPLPHTHVWCRPPHPDINRAQRHEQLLAQSPEMDDEQLLLHPTSILAREACLPPIVSYCRYQRRLAALRVACAPPYANPAAARLPPSFPSLSSFRAQDSSRHLTKGLSSVYLPLYWRTKVPSPPLRKHLPIDALAHLTLPLQEGLTRLPLVLHTLPHRARTFPQQSS